MMMDFILQHQSWAIIFAIVGHTYISYLGQQRFNRRLDNKDTKEKPE